MEAHDFLANHLQVRRPILLELLLVGFVGRSETYSGDVIRQRVQPDVNHVLGIVGHRNAPGKSAATNREVAQPAAHKGHHLIAPRLRTNELRLFRIQLQQLVLKCRELEEIVFLVHRLRRTAALRAGRAGTDSVHILLIKDAVLSGIGSLVDVAVIANSPEEFLYSHFMTIFGGADEIVICDPHPVPQSAERR